MKDEYVMLASCMLLSTIIISLSYALLLTGQYGLFIIIGILVWCNYQGYKVVFDDRSCYERMVGVKYRASIRVVTKPRESKGDAPVREAGGGGDARTETSPDNLRGSLGSVKE